MMAPRDVLSYLVVIALASIACVCVFTCAHLDGTDKQLGTALIAIASGATGALAGALSQPKDLKDSTDGKKP